MKTRLFLAGFLAAPVALLAQVADPPPAPAAESPAAAPAAKPANSNANSQSKFLGRDVPFFDPDNETVTWDGKSWNVTNNRFFQARFEKYLNAPAEDDEKAKDYEDLLARILGLLSPRQVNPTTLDEAFSLLPKASAYARDAGLCDTIANQVYSAWQSQQDRARMLAATKALDAERARLARSKVVTLDRAEYSTRGGSRAKKNERETLSERAGNERLSAEILPYDMRIAEITALIKANEAKREMKSMQGKIEFQSLIVQLFLQRRFQHVLIATRFYRNVFTDGDDQVRVKGNAENIFDKTTGMPPTVGTLDAMANEVMRDVTEGVDAFEYLLDRDELDSATKRLSEAFLAGEYLPAVRTLDRSKKRQCLAYAQRGNQLVNAIEVKDYALAERLVNEMQDMAKDFDSSKPMAAVQTAKTIAAMHLAKAKNAAVSGDHQTLEAELTTATEIWPRNPQLADVAGMIFTQGNSQNKALVDFDQLLSQKNYRQIFDDKERFIAAVAFAPDRQAQLRKVLDDMTEIEGSIIRAQEIEKRGDFAGAWESAESAFTRFPNDSKLNTLRANLTTKAADFVRALRRAEELEKRGQPGSSLAWFLKAQQEYPNSDFAREGIERLTKEILPDAS